MNDVSIIFFLDRPDPPLLRANSTKTKSSIQISWLKPSFNGYSPLLSYQLDYRTSANPSRSIIVVIPAEETSHKITGLEPYTRYEVSVRAKNALGLSDFSNVRHIETNEDGEVILLKTQKR
jgi:titin